MSRRAGTSAKAQALAKATEAVARHDAERIERDKRLQATLAEFFHAQGEVERIRTAADKAAAPFDAAMCDSVRAIESLGETRTGIASLTGLSMARLREYLASSVSAVDEQPLESSTGAQSSAIIATPVAPKR